MEDVLVSLIIFVKKRFFTHKQQTSYSLFCVKLIWSSMFFSRITLLLPFSSIFALVVFSSLFFWHLKNPSPYAAWGGRPRSFSLKAQFSLNPQIASACRSWRATHWTTRRISTLFLNVLTDGNRNTTRGWWEAESRFGSVSGAEQLILWEYNDSFPNTAELIRVFFTRLCFSSSCSRYLWNDFTSTSPRRCEGGFVFDERAPLQSKSNRSVTSDQDVYDQRAAIRQQAL